MKYKKMRNHSTKGNIVLKEVSIEGNVCGEFVEFVINHIYENIGKDDVRGVYTFPIPDTAVISGIEVNLGGSVIYGKVQSKEEIEKVYENLVFSDNEKLQLEELNKDKLKLSMGTILKGERVGIKVSYIEELSNFNNQLKLTIPHIIHPVNMFDEGEGQKENNKYKLSLNLLIETFDKTFISCDSHPIKVEEGEGNVYKVNLKNSNCALNEDMNIWLKEEKTLEASGMIYENYEDDSGIVYLKLLPDVEGNFEGKKGNYIFLIDISYSMEGDKLKEAKTALQLCLRNLSSEDKFNVVAMGDKLTYFSNDSLVKFNNGNLILASKWIDDLACENDALIFEGIKYGFDNEQPGEDNVIIIFTDDVVDNEKEIFDYVSERESYSRIFPFGIDAAVNTYFINKIARLTMGKAEFINPSKRIEDVVLTQFNRIRGLQITDVEIDWGRMKVDKTYPRTIEYIYDGEPFSIFAKVLGNVEGVVTINGLVDNKRVQRRVMLSKVDLAVNADLIEKVWYKKRIESIENRIIYERDEIYEAMRKKIIELSTVSGIISNETSFVLLEEIYEPVLGGVMRRFLPVSSSAMKEEKPVMSNFYYDQNLENIDLDQLKWDGISKEDLLRIIATQQLANGDFSYSVYDSEEEKLLCTAEAIIAFTRNNIIIDMYRNLLIKGAMYILDNYTNYPEEGEILAFCFYAIKEVNSKLILKDNQRVKINEALEKIIGLMEQCKVDINKLEEIILDRIQRDRNENILSEIICNLIN
ncbi:MAG: VIT and VWA domain-containing protein [Clostridium sp.]